MSKFPNLKHFSSPNSGGHFLSYEAPEVAAKEALKFFNDIEFDKI